MAPFAAPERVGFSSLATHAPWRHASAQPVASGLNNASVTLRANETTNEDDTTEAAVWTLK